MLIINVENQGMASFHDCMQLTELATRLRCGVRTTILGREIIAMPGDDPHRLYDGLGMTNRGEVPEGQPITMDRVNRYCNEREKRS